MTDFRSIDTQSVRSTAHLAVITSTEPTTRSNATNRFSAAASYDGAVATANTYAARVAAVSLKYATVEEALQEMVEVSGVTGFAAEKAVEAILGNPNLLAKAQRAFDRAHMSNA